MAQVQFLERTKQVFAFFCKHRIHTKEQTADSGSDCVGKKPLLIAYNAWPADGGATFNQESIF
jgi:hypothetical protein